MKTKMFWMNTGEEDERLNVSGKGCNKIVAHARFQMVIELAPVEQICLCLIENMNSHAFFRNSLSFTSDQSLK